jgi:hypothetical protein
MTTPRLLLGARLAFLVGWCLARGFGQTLLKKSLLRVCIKPGKLFLGWEDSFDTTCLKYCAGWPTGSSSSDNLTL